MTNRFVCDKGICRSIKWQGRMMLPEISSISFVVNTERHTQKRLIMKYASIAQNLSTTISINGVKVENVHLVPTRNSESFTEKWFNFPIPFKKGKNVITISSPQILSA